MIKEAFPQDNIKQLLQEKVIKMVQILEQKSKNIIDAPEGTLRVSFSGKSIQYYCVPKGQKNGKYISKKKKTYIRQLAQKEYDLKIIKLLTNEIKLSKKYIAKSKMNFPYPVKMDKKKLPLITPITFTNFQYASLWKDAPYKTKGFTDRQTAFVTSSSLKVRSKSEIIISELLSKHEIPFRYEARLRLSNIYIYPDFTCLNVRTKKEYIWEHFGMLDETEYANKTVKKMNTYYANGYYPGENLLITTETKQSPLTSEAVETMIKHYLI